MGNGGPKRPVGASMETSNQYRQFAAECDRMAKQADTERQRDILREMAKEWRKLAEDADRRDQR
jgi:hypothetical protein